MRAQKLTFSAGPESAEMSELGQTTGIVQVELPITAKASVLCLLLPYRSPVRLPPTSGHLRLGLQDESELAAPLQQHIRKACRPIMWIYLSTPLPSLEQSSFPLMVFNRVGQS